MDTLTVISTIQDRLNGGSTNRGQKLSKRQIVYAFNKAQLQWFTLLVKMDERDQITQEKIQKFLVNLCKAPTKDLKNSRYRLKLPDDYFWYQRVVGDSFNEECSHEVYAYPTEEGAVNRNLSDSFSSPSLPWQETFFTVSNDYLNFYVKDFKVRTLNLHYYKCPREIDCEGIIHSDRDGVNINPEVDKISLHEIIDLTVQILSSDIMDNNRFQTTQILRRE